jgi:hypothetical protein
MTQQNEGNPEMALLEKVKPYLIALLQTAPKFGSCSLDIVFHDGKLTRVTTTTGVSIKPE